MTGFDPRAFKGRKAAVLGLGKSGLACAMLLAKKGFTVIGSDIRPSSELKESLGRLPSKISLAGGSHGRGLARCGFAVKSPGIKPDAPALADLRARGVPVFSEIEVALAFSKSDNVAAVTGTNGKTTTSVLLWSVFKKGLPTGKKALLCGNVGTPASDAAPGAKKGDWLVVEASSYQLEDSRRFCPKISVFLNVAPDHLDHHAGMDAYLRAKAKIFMEQSRADFCVLNADDPAVVKLARPCRAQKLFFGLNPGPGLSAWTGRGKIWVKFGKSKAAPAALTPPKLPGEHNLQNAMAAALAARAAGLKLSAVAAAFKAFRGVEHRIEDAGTFKGIRCVNDSKATNVDSTLMALKSFPDAQSRLLLILGGRGKGSPYHPLRPLVEAKVKAILTIGEAAAKIESDLGDLRPLFPCGTLETAVKTAFQIGSPGDVLLLSPACASFDQFKDFEDRGRQFKDLTRRLGR
ncbi:MAG TPA: UDP-N-acetylmuramoyl-L-alanine--D-glutamate ligase [Elusimicrobiota bacterium]|nr:UDP-N-acetylmuramoyl-L-alanine--D-glutamate ligase [Elusimicrobiota bacterium]